MSSVKRLLLSFVVASVACIGWSSPAVAAKGAALPAGGFAQVNKAKCGFVDGAWKPGTLLKTGNFLTTSASIRGVQKQLKKRGISTAAKAKLNKTLKKLKKALKKNAKLCAGLPVATPTPVATPASPLPGHVTVAWNAHAMTLAGNVGGEYLYFCPANPFETLPTIYGNDVYSADSAICVAAVHLGLFNRGVGGNVRFKIKGAQSYFFGSVRNGIESQFFGPFSGSYVFQDLSSGAELLTGSIPQITWFRSANTLYASVGQQFTFVCPSGLNQSADDIWGTDIYTSDSSICYAAVHAGRISRNDGGVVVILIQPGQLSYAASTRNGVTSSSYGSWDKSFSFLP